MLLLSILFQFLIALRQIVNISHYAHEYNQLREVFHLNLGKVVMIQKQAQEKQA